MSIKKIEEKLQNVKDNVEPRLEHQGKLMTNIKTYYYNRKNVIQEAIKKSGVPLEGIKNENDNSWMNEYNFEEIEKQINIMKTKKEMAKYLLKKIDHLDHKTITLIIESVENIDEINVINRLLTRSLVEKNVISEEMIKEQIIKDNEMSELLEQPMVE